MKKLPIISILTIITSTIAPALNSAKTHALTIDSIGNTWWTVSEILEYKSQIDEEGQTLCGGDTTCLQNYRQTKLAEEEKFNALTRLQDQQLIPTELDFKNKTIKILLFDENMYARGTSREPQTGVMINELAIWLGNRTDSTNGIAGNKIRKVINNEVDGVYPVFGFTSDAPLELKKDKEIEYPMQIDLENIEKYKPSYIRYSVRANYFGSSMVSGPASCLFATNLFNGKCVLNVSARDFRYVFEEEEEASSDEVKTEEPIEPEQPAQPTEPEEPEDPAESNISIENERPKISDEPEKPEIPTTHNIPTNSVGLIPLSPNTGTLTGPCITKTIEFPWWIMGLIALGDVVVLWLFWPKSKNVKNLRKKS